MTLTAELPQIRVDSVRKLVDDGLHNGFTDMVRYKGWMYLVYRTSPTGHEVLTDSSIVVLRSRDGVDWSHIHHFGPIPLRDLRDPHFLIFRDTLFIYSGAWIIDEETGGHSIADHQGYAAWTSDGETWQGPQAMKGTFGYYIWRCAAHGDYAYLCGRRLALIPQEDVVGVIESVLLRSEDGLKWQPVGLFQEQRGNEVAFVFDEDGAVTALARCMGGAQVCRSQPPYRQWTRTTMDFSIGGPLLIHWAGRLLVGYRKILGKGDSHTTLGWLVDDKIVDMVRLPGGGDHAYPGFIPLSETRGLVSYYSSHEGSGGKTAPCHIYLAEISLHEDGKKQEAK